MGKRKASVSALLVCTGLLAALGCWFCWLCPSRFYEGHKLLDRQIAWNCIGLVVFACAWLAGWRRLLKAAPWLLAIWVSAYAAAQISSPVRGATRWLVVGSFRVDVVTCFVPVLALFAAWLHEKKRIRPWMEWVAVAVAAACACWFVAGSAGRMERLAEFFRPVDWMSDSMYRSRQFLLALDSSNWFGGAGKNLAFLPSPESEGMMSASALLIGRWFPSAVFCLLAVMGAALTLLWRGDASASKRRYLLLFGLWLFVPAVYCLLHSLALLPVFAMSPALVGYGGSAVVMAWFGVGVLAAMARHSAEDMEAPCDSACAWPVCAAWGVLAALAVVAIAAAPGRKWRAPDRGITFVEPYLG